MSQGRATGRQDPARQGERGRIIDTTGELPIAPRRTPTPQPRVTAAPRGASFGTPDALYVPRERVDARPLRHTLTSIPLVNPRPERQPVMRRIARGCARALWLVLAFVLGRIVWRLIAWIGASAFMLVGLLARALARTPWGRGVARLVGPPIAALAVTLRRPNPKTLMVYLVIFVVLAQTLVGALTPLARGERQAIGGALLALAAASPATPTPFPIGPTPRPVSSPQAFIATMLPYARQAHRDLGWPVSMTLAQMGVEHGWRLPDFDGWNLANSRPFPDPAGDGGVCFRQKVVRDFCYAPTPQIGLAIYEHVAHLSFYSGIAQAARTGGAAAAARAMGQSPWDAGHYMRNGVQGGMLLAAMDTYNLYQYDQ
ncbi:MAG TPA: hypothetical protein VFN78_03335 [Ktedonobacterales bacterium]|nr:hypothetical protein [Ktedonobacterales bacterium]